jgi:ABC-type transport system involved in cytochrome c biogenesis permease subunit
VRVERLPYIVVLGCYAFATVVHLLPGVLRVPDGAARRAVAFGAVLHAAALGLGIWIGPWTPGLPEALSALSLGVALAYAWNAEGRLRALGMALCPLALVALGTALVVPHRAVSALAQTGYSPWLPVHLGLVFSGIGGFALAFGVGVTYLVVRARLKSKRLDAVGRMPSLEVLDRIQFRAMLFGFVFLTLGIGAGGAWAAASLTEPWAVDPKVLFTVLIWVWYGLALQVRLVAGRRGRWTALFSIVGFAGLLFSLIGVNFLVSGFHAYGG